ncbi:DUF1569 domain-containing protein [Pedobacter sp. NJ-S-72]
MNSSVHQLVNTSNRRNLEKLFLELKADATPLWGKMKPQQMVEHLIDQVQYTNGKKEPFCEVSLEEAQLARQANIYTDLEIPKNVIFGDIPDQLIYPDLSNAISQLMIELRDFDAYFKKPGTTAIHGAFGPMNYDEWIIWHSRHFKHHLKQFGL